MQCVEPNASCIKLDDGDGQEQSVLVVKRYVCAVFEGF